MKIVLIGPPASGKGSQANLLEKHFKLPHISTGDMFRHIMEEDTPLGKEVKKYMDKASLVPDDVAIKVVEKHLSKSKFKNGFILDGYPRTLKQAKAIDEVINIDFVILLDVSYEELEERILTRVICNNCGEVYSSKFYKNDFCAICGTKLIARKDDDINIIKARYREYESLTKPVVSHYKNKSILKVIRGNSSIEVIFDQIKKLLINKL